MLFFQEIVRQIWFSFLRRKKVAFTGAPEGSKIALEHMRQVRDCAPGTDENPMPKKGYKSRKKESSDEVDDDKLFWDDLDEEEFYEGMFLSQNNIHQLKAYSVPFY